MHFSGLRRAYIGPSRKKRAQDDGETLRESPTEKSVGSCG
jgi:hypothetical protein